jgi:hypothetical protein
MAFDCREPASHNNWYQVMQKQTFDVVDKTLRNLGMKKKVLKGAREEYDNSWAV